jgi:hypothetical protein
MTATSPHEDPAPGPEGAGVDVGPAEHEDEGDCLCDHGVRPGEETADEELPATSGGVAPAE